MSRRQQPRRGLTGRQILQQDVFGRRIQGGSGSSSSITWLDIEALGYFTILTNGDPVTPEVMFDSNGDAIVVSVPL